MNTILVPLDFSSTSLNAAKYALGLARQTGAKLILLHAYELPVAYPVKEGLELSDEGIKKMKMQELEKVREMLAKEDAWEKVECMILDGSLVDVIREFENTFDTFLVVMGLTGAGKVKETLIGSNTLDVAKHSGVPVMIIPEKTSFDKIRHIALATDFRDVVENIPEKQIRQFIDATGARLHIVNVDYLHEYATPDTPMQSGLLEAMFSYHEPEFHFVEDKDIIGGLNHFVTEHRMDLLIMIPHKHNIFEKIFVPSHTRELVFHTNKPVLVMHE